LKAELAKREGESLFNNKRHILFISQSMNYTLQVYISDMYHKNIKAKNNYLNIPGKSKKVKASE